MRLKIPYKNDKNYSNGIDLKSYGVLTPIVHSPLLSDSVLVIKGLLTVIQI